MVWRIQPVRVVKATAAQDATIHAAAAAPQVGVILVQKTAIAVAAATVGITGATTETTVTTVGVRQIIGIARQMVVLTIIRQTIGTTIRRKNKILEVELPKW